ncbi:uncharacterized protein J7T54_000809 [Emericellopsis cladophorae]|uniref:Uncharacterized protein n=1 Tax=Emericellopsis cladophorae TaxID=2686198 RepID=A0A9P9XVB4_9HYPO|nr:uncharacterized protein J7T54_000809 [Emericellopsis cladophorae]KAI6778420.1 hypothetical protein J7T54_000809 [Emericellopsis cladophorae]
MFDQQPCKLMVAMVCNKEQVHGAGSIDLDRKHRPRRNGQLKVLHRPPWPVLIETDAAINQEPNTVVIALGDCSGQKCLSRRSTKNLGIGVILQQKLSEAIVMAVKRMADVCLPCDSVKTLRVGASTEEKSNDCDLGILLRVRDAGVRDRCCIGTTGLCVQVGTMIKEISHNVQMAMCCGSMQRRGLVKVADFSQFEMLHHEEKDLNGDFL